MRKAFIPAVWLFCAALPTASQAQSRPDENARAYIARYKDLAISEQKRTGMPAAIKLAQGLHETGAGTSPLATQGNNHFGLKCKKDWKGESMSHTDDAPNECFRKYSCAEDSYRDQGNYLRSNPRYATCFATDVKDYKTWAMELRRAGYATNPKYAEKLAKTIEDYNLQQYTLLAAGETPIAAVSETPRPTVAQAVRQDIQSLTREAAKVPEKAREIAKEVAGFPEKAREAAAHTFQKGGDATPEIYKGLQGFYAKAGQSLLAEATRFNVRYAKLLEWNDLADAPLPYDMFIFLEKKPARGSVATHVVKPGETLHQIAQLEAIQLTGLRQLNMLDLGEEPQPGAVLQLQRGTSVRPAVYLPSQQKAPAAVADVVQRDIWTESQPEMKVKKAREVSQDFDLPPASTTVVARQERVPAMPVVVEPEKAIAPPPVVVAPLPAIPEKPIAAAPVAPPKPTRVTPPPVVAETPVKATSGNGFITKSEIAETPAPMMPPPMAAAPTPAPVEAAAPPAAVSEIPETTPAETPPPTTVIATEPEAPAAPEKPVYDDTPMGRLKAKMDKAVYAKPPVNPAADEQPAAAPPEAPKQETPKTTTRPAFHTVAKGETVFSIAKKYGLSVTELRKWNHMDFSAMKEGQKLKLKP